MTQDTASVELFEYETRQQLSREHAAAVLRELADSLLVDKGLRLKRHGLRHAITVPNMVELEVEVKIGQEYSLEVEISW